MIPVLILLIFFAAGLCIFRDYGASADEHIQIDSGHVVWRYLCEKFGRPVPEPIADVPDLHGFKNSYYGQAATFPTVLLEALRGFTLDSSTIIRIRHLWNFLSYFVGLCCLTWTFYKVFGSWQHCTAGLLIMILLPRIFGDIFYNDRDMMLLSWMMISTAAFYHFSRHPGWLSALLCGAVFGMTFNTRIFGLVLLVFPALFFLFSGKRRYAPILVITAFLFWFLLSPIAWEDPIRTIPDAFRHFSTQQRYLDTNSEASLLFFGRKINETKLPWYYIPLYILVTMPAATSIAALAGIFIVIRKALRREHDIRSLISFGMLIILCTVQLVGIIFHLTFYNGWRHFYFLNLPIVWLAVESLSHIEKAGRPFIRIGAMILMAASFLCSLVWIIQAHPYQIIYLNPVFRSRWIGKFDRDYWILSTTECMNYLIDNAREIDLNVVDKYTFIEYTIIGLPPRDRERFHAMYHSAQPIPYEYLFFNYSNVIGNEASFDYYVPIHAVTRDGIKLAEVFQRSHNDEMDTAAVIENISSSRNGDSAQFIADGDFGTAWYGGENPADLILHLNEEYAISSLEIFPAEGSAGFPKAKLSVSEDGNSWKQIQTYEKGSNGIGFSSEKTAWIRLESESENTGIRDIIFYGKQDPADQKDSQ